MNFYSNLISRFLFFLFFILINVFSYANNEINISLKEDSAAHYSNEKNTTLFTITPNLNKPAAGMTYSSQIPVTLTLGESYISNSAKLIFTNISGTYSNTLVLVNNTLSQSFTITTSSILSSTNIVSSTFPTLPDGTYNVTLSYRGSSSPSASEVTNTNVIIQTSTPAPTLTNPSNGFVFSRNISPVFSYNLPSAALTGTALLTLNPGYSYALETSIGSKNYTITSNLPVDGTYTATVSYQDFVGNPAASSGSIRVTFDRTTLSPSILAPATNTTVSGTSTITYLAPEASMSGSKKLTFSKNGTLVTTLSINDVNNGSLFLNFKDLSSTSSQYSALIGTSNIEDGTYSVTFSYQDINGNPASTSSINLTIKERININYVDAVNGNDATGIGSLNLPYKKIQIAIDKSIVNDTVVLKRGTYNEVVDLKGKISLLSSLYIFTGDTNDISNTILSGSTTGNNTLIINSGTPAIASHHIYALTIQDVRLLSVNLNSGNDNYIFKLSKSIIKNSGTYGQGGVIGIGNNGILDSCRIFNNKGKYIVSSSGFGSIGPIISNNTFFNNSSSSDGTLYVESSVVHVEGTNKARILNNLIYKNLTSGIDFGGNGQDSMIFINNTVALNKGYGIRFETFGGVYSGILINNISKFNSQLDISCNTKTNGPGIYLKNNFFGTAGSTFGTGLASVNNTILDTTGNIGGDPYFVDTLNNNYRLKAQSRAIGAGAIHTYSNLKDIQGNDRINSWRLKPDIGAFESEFKFTSPLLIKTEPGNKKVALFWTQTPNTNIKAYKIYRSTSSIPDNSTSTFIADVTGVSTLTYNDVSTDLENGTTYYYRLKAVHNDNSLSGFSNELLAIPADVVIPTNFKLNNGPATTRLNWTSVGLTGAKYQLFRGTNLNSKTLLIDSLNAIIYDDTTPIRNTTYYYWIKTMNATGALSEFSEPIKLTPSNIWYVDSASGNNTTGIGSSILPYKRITTAVNASIAGDTILVGKGTYLDNLILTKELTILALNTQANTILKPLLPNSQIVNFTSGSNNSKLSGFTLTGGGNVRGSAIDCNFSSPTIERCIITNSGGEAPIRYYYSDAIINNCLIYKNVGSRVFFYDPIPVAPKVNHSTIVYNNGIGTGSSNTSVIPVFTNCIIYGNSGGTFGGNISILNSIIQGDYPGNETNINANPKFIDSSLNDYRLQDYSPAIGLGTVIPGINKDFEGTNKPLPLSSNPDAGAYENNFGHPAPILNSISTTNRVINLKWSVNILRNSKSFKIYRGTSPNPTTKIDSISSSNLVYSDTVTNGIKYYYRVSAVNTDNLESAFSNELIGISFGVTLLDSPFDKKIKESLTPNFKWQTLEFATNYNLQISNDSLFANPLIDTVSSISSIVLAKVIQDNSTYFWRVRAGDRNGYGNWSNKSSFKTLITPPVLLSILPGNKVDTLKWSIGSSKNIKYFKIYADTVTNPTKLKDSISGLLDTYIDKVNLQLNVKYFYRIVAGNQENIESDFSNTLNVVPINSLPKAIKLANKTVQNAGEFNFVKLSYSSNGSIDTDGKITSFNWYVNDSLVNKTDSVLNYFFKLGTNSIKLIVTDNDGGKDSSTSVLNLSSVQKVFPAGILGGISAINPNYILTADTSFNNTIGSSVSILDRSGNAIFPIIVQSRIFTTPSIASDTSIFITNGSSLNGYSKSGVSLWPTIPLGGISYVTPTIDSNFNRIYVGVSNKNFFAYDYKTGKNVWSIICDAPINTSAVITGDRKLIFTSQAGTLYGFDISKSDIQTTPKWKMSFGDIITKSPAVDASSNIYVGTNAGRLIKFMLNTNGSVSVKWNVSLGSAIQTSPVIDADSNIYVGTEKGDFYKINRLNGSTIWSYNVGAAIYSTPNISEYGTIYVSNMNGLVTAITTDKRVLWKYQDIGPISANSLYINNMLYIASEKGTFTGIYDNPNSVNVNTAISSSLDNISTTKILNASSTNYASSTSLITPRKPVWGTFQGDYRRTGSLSLICPSNLSISRAANGNLISNTPNYIQWYKDGSEIPNATDSIFKPTLAGNYLIKNSQAGCNLVSSNSYYYVVTDIVNLEDNQFIKVTPNPYSSNVYLHFFLKGYNSLNVDVFDFATGRPIANRVKQPTGSNLNLQSLSTGVYIIKVYSLDMKFVHMFKIVKL